MKPTDLTLDVPLFMLEEMLPARPAVLPYSVEEVAASLEKLTKFLQIPLVILDLDTLVLDWMSNDFTGFKWTRSTPQRPFILTDFIHPDDMPRALQDLRFFRRVTTGRYESIYRIKDVHSGWNWSFVRTQPIKPRRSDKTVTHVLCQTHPLSSAIQNSNFEQLLTRETKQLQSKVFDQKLTPREKEVLRLIGQAKTDEEIAQDLMVSKLTVVTHRRNLLKKLNANSKADLVRLVFMHGLE